MKTILATFLIVTSAASAIDVPNLDERLLGLKMKLPRPESIGLTMAPKKEPAVIGGINCHSPIGSGGFMGGDQILNVDGKRIRTIQDFRWALHKARSKPSITIVVAHTFIKPNGTPWKRTITVKLPPNWWRQGDDRP